MTRTEVDLCVIGGGSGGLSVAAGAAQMGARVALIEAGRMGGDCLNVGCVPSKALIAAGRRAAAMGAGGPFGVAPVAPEVDFAAAKDHVARVIAAIAPHDSVERFEGLGVRVVQAQARFVSDREVEAGGLRIAARRFVIATGSRPVVPAIPGLETVRAYTNEDIFDLRERPTRLVIVGGGAIGLELAQAHRRLGCAVTVIEGRRALGTEDPDLSAIVLARLRAEGVEILEDAPAERIEAGPEGPVVHAAGRAVAGSHLLVAVGRRAVVEGLGLEAAGVRTGPRGVIVDAGLRTSNRRVYAIGDAVGGGFTHVAGHHASVVVRAALFGLPARPSAVLPRVTFTDPELAQVGPVEAEARRLHGDRLETLRVPYADSDRARTDGLAEGLVKVLAVRGRPVAAGIAGAQAGELVGLWTFAIANRVRLSALAGMVAPYPTLGELSKRAAGLHFAPRLFESPAVKRIVRLVQRLP